MRFASVLAALLAVALCAATGAWADRGNDVVKTTAGEVVGIYDSSTNIRQFRGIFYGASTAGANRYMPPKARAPWSGQVNTTNFVPSCVSPYVNPNVPKSTSEDCLALNVFSPYTTKGSSTRVPVMVWFYGGSFSMGSSQGPLNMYDGSYIAQTENVVVVTVNYRLSALGFLVTDSLKGNQGILDQRLALQWVQDNIAAFGGDKTQVTIFGESAGAMSVGIHLTSPASYPLYKRALMQSNPIGVRMMKNDRAAIFGREFCRLQKCLTGGKCDTACLQKQPMATVQKALLDTLANQTVYVEANHDHLLDGLLGFKPTVDGTVVPDNFVELWAKNAVNPNAAVLVGTTTDEATVFAYTMKDVPKISMLEYGVLAAAVFGANSGVRLSTYYSKLYTDGFAALSRTITDMWFRCSATKFATVSAAKTGKAAYVYRYGHVFSQTAVWTYFEFPKQCHTQVCHAVELPFTFHFTQATTPELTMSMTAAEKALAAQMVSYWANFAKTGNPNTAANGNTQLALLNAAEAAEFARTGDETHLYAQRKQRRGVDVNAPAWPKWAADSRPNIVLDTGFPTENSKALCEMWDKIGYIVPMPNTTAADAGDLMGGFEAGLHTAETLGWLRQMPKTMALLRGEGETVDAAWALLTAAKEIKNVQL